MHNANRLKYVGVLTQMIITLWIATSYWNINASLNCIKMATTKAVFTYHGSVTTQINVTCNLALITTKQV